MSKQADGKPMDHRTDIYSLGIVLYEMVVGRVPYQDPAPMRVIFKHIYEAPPAPRKFKRNLPEPVEQVILKALAKNPADRYDRAGDLAEALQRALETVLVQPITSPAAPAPAPTRPKRRARKPAASPHAKKNAGSPQPVKVAPKPARPDKADSAKPQRTPPLKPSRSVSTSGMIVVGGSLLLLLIAGILIFFTSSGDAESLSLGSSSPGAATETGLSDNHTPAPMATPPSDTSILAGTPTPPTASIAPPLAVEDATTPTPLASISGTLAIPVTIGGEFKVFVTG
ncbi:MAG: hypothetical protein HYR94_07020, partial [Chloroflexi bacterium]|nr:hypothetical protein [Chloroflexota bacterium]